MYSVLINASSKQVRDSNPDAVRDLILSASGKIKPDIRFTSAEDFEGVLQTISKDTPLLVGGGDGTILQAASVLRERGKPFGILPMGTMNLLARDLKIPLDYKKAMQSYTRKSKEKEIDIGYVNDTAFLCAVGMRLMPEASRIREDARRRRFPDILTFPRIAAHVFNRLDAQGSKPFTIRIDDSPLGLRTNALVVTNNTFIRGTGFDSSFRKKTLQSGVLGLYSLQPSGVSGRLQMIWHLMNGVWKKNPSVRSFAGVRITIETDLAEEEVSVDGEIMKMQTPLVFTIDNRALTLLVPAK